MNSLAGRLLLGLVMSLAIGGLGYSRRSLSASGALGAVLVGTTVFGLGGWVWGGTLVAFFASSSLLSHYQERRKAVFAEKFSKSSRRDLGQVLANGGVAALLALLVGLLGKGRPVYPLLAYGFFGALAAVNADTWATELGVLSAGSPRLIIGGRPAVAGTSGAVTLEGTLAAAAGAAFIGGVAFVLIQGAAILTSGHWLFSDWLLIPVATVSGLAGSLFDSLLGASVQAIYVCPACGVETERTRHRCGQPTRHVRGWRWLNNDWVNLFASLVGAILAAAAATVAILV
jgi:uncharacterized protein (TIGR00297 family)